MPKGIKHGQTRTSEWKTWETMIQRCTNPNSKRYHTYGARGIKVCDRWRKDFLAFLADMGKRPSPTHTLDRINNDGDYEPSNCRWATKKQQARNRTTTHTLTIAGETKAMSAWCEQYSVPLARVGMRIKAGWDPLVALTLPPIPRKLTRKCKGGAGVPVETEAA